VNLVLTHEQADFDALASLLGGYLLDDTALPVLPRRINRNGRAFLNLYGAELPFVNPRDLPAGAIDSILLVDTQSLVTLKGLSKYTRIQIIDHHKPRPDLPEDWQAICEQSGACTTLLVESLQESIISLSMIQATLLLLGIYEDTGSLTYTSTTARDGRAVAYLLEQGANLRILSEYLNPPLSVEQRRVYNLLLNSAENLTINGQTIVITRASAGTLDDEISSVAHKLRDLLDSDALFLLVDTQEGIRMVARSTTDRVNVADIAAVFGGGGHERAASALVRTKDNASLADNLAALEQIHHKLLEILPRHVQPAITVGQIMSRRPHLLTPETPAQEAAQLMQRHGYEGYPVVKNGKVVGLLTRRAVDKAVAHRLNLAAGSLMDGGQYYVRPGDSIDELQQVMTTSGWGQVPVVDPSSGEIIGIVTRTDLLKSLTPQSTLPSSHNLTAKLEAALPPSRLGLLKAVAAHAHAQHMAVFIVGGFVRDLLLDRPSLDFDVVVEGDAIALGGSLAHHFGGHVVTHNRFGTAKWHILETRQQIAIQLGLGDQANIADLPESLDLISARSEFYEHPTALPTVERSSIKQDLHRRDFTINTLALRLDGRHYGELHDYWGGLSDLRQGLVRVLHSLSFVDDPTRLLRAVRFEQRFSFRIEPRTLDLMKEALSLLKQVSGERLHHELDLIFEEESASAILSRLNELGILSAIDVDLTWDKSRQLGPPVRNPAEADPGWAIPPRISGIAIQRVLSYLVWLSCLPEKVVGRISSRLKLAGYLDKLLQQASHLRQMLPHLAGIQASQVVEILDEVPLVAIYAVFLQTPNEELHQKLYLYATQWRHIETNINGNTLRSIGLQPSPAFRTILKTLRSAWLDGSINNPAEEEAMLQSILQQWNLPPGSPA
jgi:tRNA nucleotidyltransferase (CCA-adding enzyme)